MIAWPGRLVLLGHPVGHSLSPAMQNAALRAAGVPLVYEALDVPRSALEETLAQLRRARAAGNVTIPYKEAVRAACDRLTDAARAVGAVNTFWTGPDGAMVGDNTDVDGFNSAIEALRAPGQSDVLAVLGAGGAAAAVLHAMKGWGGARAVLYARTMSRAEALAARHPGRVAVAASPRAALQEATVLVNATPVGLHGDAMPVDPEWLPPGCIVLDMAYRPDETPLVRAARARNHTAADGLTMLLEQGAAAFERWFGVAPDRDAMRRALPPRR